MEIKSFSPENHFIKALIYGASASGKTMFAGTAENAIFASAEGGLLTIADKHPNYVEIKSLADLKELYAYLTTQKHSFKTVVIDSVTEINEIIKLDIEKKTGRSMQQQDWGTLLKEIRSLLRSFRDLPMHVIFIAQEVADDKDENGKTTKIVPSLNGKAATEIAYFMDIVGYSYVTPTGEHRITTATSSRLLTKDRSQKIGSDAPLNFTEWEERIKTIKTEQQKTVVNFQEKKPITSSIKLETLLSRIDAMRTHTELEAAREKTPTLKISDEDKQVILDHIQDKLDLISAQEPTK